MLSQEQLTTSMRNILKTADLDTLSAKQVRKLLEDEFKCEMTEHKKFIDKKLMQLIDELPTEQGDHSSSEASSAEEEKEPVKKTSATKRKASSEIKPVAKKKPAAKKKAVPKGEIYTASESDTEIDNSANNRPVRKTVPAKRGAVKLPGSRTEVADCKLSPALAAVVGAEILSRSEVTRRIHQECIIRKLHESDERIYIICDEEFKNLFGGQERLRVSTLTNHCKKHITKLTKAELGGGKKKTGKATGYMAPVWISPALADVLGHNRMSRSQVVKELWKIIKERGLQDPKNGKFMLVDDQLMPVFKQKRIQTFGMLKYISSQLSKEDIWNYEREYPEYMASRNEGEEQLPVKEEEKNGIEGTNEDITGS